MDTKEMLDIALKVAELDKVTVDSGIQNEHKDVKKVLAGIDMGPAEILAAYQLGYDCVCRHHNMEGNMPYMGTMVRDDHVNFMVKRGVPVNVAQGIMKDAPYTVNRAFHAANLEQATQMAKLLNIGFIGLHTPADLCVERKLQKLFDDMTERKPDATVQDAIDELYTLREYQMCKTRPEAWVGSPERKAGKICVTMSGGMAAGWQEMRALVAQGYGTFVTMHLDKESEKNLKEDECCNVIVAGHMASDSIGLNTILEAWEKAGIQVDRIGGIV